MDSPEFFDAQRHSGKPGTGRWQLLKAGHLLSQGAVFGGRQTSSVPAANVRMCGRQYPGNPVRGQTRHTPGGSYSAWVAAGVTGWRGPDGAGLVSDLL